jgi:hypothetical protein
MKKIFVAMVFAFVFATGMAVVTVIAQIDWTSEKLQSVMPVTDALASSRKSCRRASRRPGTADRGELCEAAGAINTACAGSRVIVTLFLVGKSG